MKKVFLASLLILSAFASARDDEKDDNQVPPAQATPAIKQGMVATTPASLMSAPINESYFPQPAYFRKRFETPSTKVEVQPPVRLPDFVVGGKLELSLKNYLDLVFSNNCTISFWTVMS